MERTGQKKASGLRMPFRMLFKGLQECSRDCESEACFFRPEARGKV